MYYSDRLLLIKYIIFQLERPAGIRKKEEDPPVLKVNRADLTPFGTPSGKVHKK